MKKMSKLQVKHWQDAAVALLGLWFAGSPWVLDLTHSTPAVAASLALGLALVAMAIGALLVPHQWERWATAALGAGAAASPWLLGYAGDTVAWRNAVATGLLTALLALWVVAHENRAGRRKVLSGTDAMAH